MKLSCVVVSYEVRDLLRDCLVSVSGADEVIVVDNGSRDGSCDMVRREFPEVRLLERPDNPGFSTAINLAVSHARGDALFLFNPDCVLGDGQLQGLKQRLQRYPEVSAFGFRQVDERGAFQLAHGGPPRLSYELARNLAQRAIDRGWRWPGRVIDRAYSRPTPVAWIAGSSILVRREAFDAVGGFDETFFLYFEDIDFCLRLQADGYKVVYDPTLTVTHRRGESASKNAVAAERGYRESQLYFWRKHRGAAVAAAVAGYQRLRRIVR